MSAGSAPERALRHVAGLSCGEPLDPHLRVTVHFHPDRRVGDRSVLKVLADDGVYLTQFVTGTSGGGVSPYPGGFRWDWEHRTFAGAYDAQPPHVRPVYGGLNIRDRAVGAAPRFGSAHLRLDTATLARSSFCYPDSVFAPTAFGVAGRMALVALAEADDRDPLDDYVEAHVHGGVRLDRDVDALVLDPCYRGTPVEAAALRAPCRLEWHPGFRLGVDELRAHPTYRGQEYVDLGVEIAVDGVLDPRVLGEAAWTGRYDEQALKRVWHCVARYGVTAGGKPALLERRDR